MIKVCYSELDGPKGLSLRLEAAGHAGYAPAGQDIVCAGASTLMQALVYLLAGEESARSDAWDEPEGPRLAVAVQAPVAPWVQGAFELAKAGFTLLAERYPDNLRFADVSRSGQQSMMDLQLPGMRVQDAYRLAHYEDALRTTAQTVEQGVVERVQQRAARPLENGLRPGAAASVRPDVAAMTRAQREALERRVLHGAQIEL